MTNKEKMTTYIKNYKDDIEVIMYLTNLIEPFLMEWNGKQINKRFTDKLKLFLGPEYYVRLDTSNFSGDIALMISRKKRVLSLLMANKKNRKFNMDEYKENNKHLFNKSEQYKKYVEAEKHIDEWNTEYEKIQQSVKDLKGKMEKYSCHYIIDWSELRYI